MGAKQQMFGMYGQIRIGANPTCVACQESEARRGTPLGRPVSFWHVGDDYELAPVRLVFVGKNAVSGKELRVRQGCRDASGRGYELYHMRFSSYWTAIEKIACGAFGVDRDTALDRIAITNLMKCNHSDGGERKDTTSPRMKGFCLNDLGVVWSELRLLRPDCVIMFTGRDASRSAGYDDYIAGFGYGDATRDVTDPLRTITIRGKEVGWWDREFLDGNGVSLRLLRTAHPQGKPDEFCDLVADWVRRTSVVRLR